MTTATAAAIKERPILFSGDMIRVIRQGRKTQTRRILKLPKWASQDWEDFETDGTIAETICLATGCVADIPHRYGKPGDRLWVRETFAYAIPVGASYRADRIPVYRADGEFVPRWTPSIFMPRAASRITLEVAGVRVERLQDISESDAIAEGIEKRQESFWRNYLPTTSQPDHWAVFANPIDSYKSLWQKINGAESWNLNPWVFVVEFKEVTA